MIAPFTIRNFSAAALNSYPRSIALRNNILVVGNPVYYDASNNSYSYSHIQTFTRSGDVFTKLGNDVIGTDSYTGFGVALNSQATVMACIPTSGTTKVAIYDREGSVWTKRGNSFFSQDTVTPRCNSVALSGDGNTLVIGNTGYTANLGCIYTFKWNGNAWIEYPVLVRPADAGVETGAFGQAICISNNGNTLYVGSHTNTVGAEYCGSVHSFQWNGNSWENPIRISPSVDVARNYFGRGLGLSSDGTILAVGACDYTKSQGKVYLYDVNFGVLSNETIVQSPSFSMYFGEIVAPEQDFLIVGANSSPSVNLTLCKYTDRYIAGVVKHNGTPVVRTLSVRNADDGGLITVYGSQTSAADGSFFIPLFSDDDISLLIKSNSMNNNDQIYRITPAWE